MGEQVIITLLEHLRFPQGFGEVRVAYSIVFYVVCTIICLFVFYFLSLGVVSLFSIYEFECPFGIFRLGSMNCHVFGVVPFLPKRS